MLCTYENGSHKICAMTIVILDKMAWQGSVLKHNDEQEQCKKMKWVYCSPPSIILESL